MIFGIDGEPVNSLPEMMFRLAARGIGADSTFAYRRGGRESEVTMTLRAPPEVPPRNRLDVADRRLVLTGLVAETINPAVIAEYGLPPGSSGVIVAEARDLAHRAGLRGGDVLLAVNGRMIRNTQDLERALGERSRFWEIEILREGRRSWLRFSL
ncbi:MAG: hypothetical protein JJU19_01305 [Pararhodobacter sp.]|nr:hypothetical protein [Pararhodobacter sp.]